MDAHKYTVDLIATQPTHIEAVPHLLEDITRDFNNPCSDEGRKYLLVKSRALVQALETPRETMVNHCWGQVSDLKLHSSKLSS